MLNVYIFMMCSVQFSRSVVSHSLRPHEGQYARPPCPSASPGVCTSSSPLSWWCRPAISSSVIPFSPCPQSLQHQSLFQWVNSSHEVAKVVSPLASFLPKNTQDWSPLEWTGWISLQSKGLSSVFLSTKVQKHQFLGAQLSFMLCTYVQITGVGLLGNKYMKIQCRLLCQMSLHENSCFSISSLI